MRLFPGGNPIFGEREREKERERARAINLLFCKVQNDDCFEHPVHHIGLTLIRMSMMVAESVLD